MQKMGTVMPTESTYRKEALKKYGAKCVYCGFAIKEVLEVAHLDGRRSNNRLSNLAPLCPTCHRMHDLDLIPTAVIKTMRDHPKKPRWAKLLKDAGPKAAETKKRKRAALRRKRKRAAKKAVETRRKRARAKKR